MKTIVAWDLGATKCAAAIVEYDEKSLEFTCKKSHSVKLTDMHSLEEMTAQLESALDYKMSHADAICIGGAGHYNGHILQNESHYPFEMCFADMAKKQDWPVFAVIHDYASVVCATFTSYMKQEANLRRLNNVKSFKSGRRVALGIGTGLGAKDGVLFDNGDFWLGQNEMGHIGIVTSPALSSLYQQRHRELMHFLYDLPIDKVHQPLTFEKILTGRGLVNLYRFLNSSASDDTPEVVGEKIRQGRANETLSLFAWYLGLFVGTVQLSFMPEEGVWITGGVILKHLNVFDCPEFFHGIEASPAYLSLRRDFPLGVLCNPDHAFIGGAYYAIKRLLG